MSETRAGSVAKFANANYGPISAMAGTQFKVTMTGTGDPDLHVRFGAAPTTTQYDCRPYTAIAAETCSLTVPVGAPAAYIMVNGYSAATFSLTLEYTKP
ncbi:PPC domain-containing protein [Myxococcus stipitatus]|uniref:PPC domain-containing protein n=1 Tax=Myxococcus stipitatus TaxID=83455 RepID=UPI0030D0E193